MFKIHHIGVVVTDTTRSRDFYQNVLNCNINWIFEHEEVILTYMECSGQIIELIEYKKDEQKNANRASGRVDHIAFLVENLDKEIEKLKEKNIDIIQGPMELPFKQRVLFFLGPDGERIEFVEKFK